MKYLKSVLILNILGISLFFSSLTQAQTFGGGCQMSKDYQYNFFAAYDRNLLGRYGYFLDQVPPVVIDRCKNDSGRFLLLSLALRFPKQVSDVYDIAVEDNYIEDQVCRVENAPIPQLVPFEKKKTEFKKQFHTLRQCTYLEIRHLDDANIMFNEAQHACKITKLSQGIYRAEGDYCMFQIDPKTRLSVQVAIRPECAQESFIRKNNLRLGDLDALLQAYILDNEAGEGGFTGRGNMPLGSAITRLSLLPEDKILPLNKEVEPDLATFPRLFSLDIHMGSLKLSNYKTPEYEKAIVDTSLFVSHIAEQKCKDGLCAGPADYRFPMVAETTLSEVRGDRTLEITSWYQANRRDPFIKPSFEGLYKMVSPQSIDNFSFENNKRYKLDMNFYNPFDDYYMMLKGYEQFVVDLQLNNGIPGVDELKPLNEISALIGLPNLPSVPSLINPQDISQQLVEILDFFKKLSVDSQFPPYYTHFCSKDLKNCLNITKEKKYLKLSTEFTVKIDPETKMISITQVEVKRESPLLSKYSRKVPRLPELVCR